MTHDPSLAERVRRLLKDIPNVTENEMFGGVVFLVSGTICCGITESQLMIRADVQTLTKAASHPHASEMDASGRPMKGFVFVDSHSLDEEELAVWVRAGIDSASSH